MWKKISVAVIAALTVGAIMTTAPRAGGDPVAKCLSNKQKAAGKKAAGLLSCLAKAAKKDIPVDPACLAKISGKFETAFAKADSKGACPGSATAVEQSVDTCVTDVGNLIPEPGKCSAAKLKAAGKKAAAKLGCNAKATAKSLPLDGACLSKAEGKFDDAFAKASGCVGDAVAVEDIVDNECIAAVVSQLQPTPTTTTLPQPACGNGTTEGTETCDDGNTVDENSPTVHPNPPDTCPANCMIGSCGAGSTTPQNVTVHITVPNGIPLGGITIFLDYPDNKTSIPGSGGGVAGSISNLPSGALSSPNDLDYGLLEGIIQLSPGFSTGSLVTVTFANCPGAPALTVGDFSCVVKDAADTGGNDVAGVTCSVSIP